ncbi:MarR family winged helix-turn-helix transcriptional regulator [Mesorhizobium amorphae]|uniref:MarR family winged helix-turn-helix transcriptional regulator n=1 Tax=Mesorhizobium amorphae TaxID=71433 RepID=UPI00177BD1E0|nr:MarR family transcriptional regulator [Mesorhizobium amorphae]
MPVERNALVGDIRRFNRFYTGLIGLLDETLTHSAYTLTEARVLFELDRRSGASAADTGGTAGFLARMFHLDIGPAASEMAGELRLEPTYLTRILRKFAAAGLTEIRADPNDRRRRLSLTARGNQALAKLQMTANQDLARLTAGLTDDEALQLSDALKRVTRLLGGDMGETATSGNRQ